MKRSLEILPSHLALESLMPIWALILVTQIIMQTTIWMGLEMVSIQITFLFFLNLIFTDPATNFLVWLPSIIMKTEETALKLMCETGLINH